MQTPSSNPGKRGNPLLYFPPPFLFALTFLAALGLQWLDPIHAAPAGSLPEIHIAGWVLVACGVCLAFSASGMFFAKRTTLIPFGNASKLVTSGPFRITRNPMYLSLTIAYLGAAALFVDPWALPLVIFPVCVMHFVVIPFEESKLRAIFGEEFDRYCASVRRWI